jgi:hypothetical protein
MLRYMRAPPTELEIEAFPATLIFPNAAEKIFYNFYARYESCGPSGGGELSGERCALPGRSTVTLESIHLLESLSTLLYEYVLTLDIIRQ